MKMFQWLQNLVQSVWNDVGNLFQPTRDDYPESGVQPYEGEPYDDQEQSS